MGYFPKGSLLKYFNERRVFGETQAWEVLRQCSSGLLELGNKNVVHRDLTPANILVRKETNKHLTFVIIDLGHALDVSLPFAKSYGTQAFSAPESLTPDPQFSVKSDVFSLAMVVIFLLRRGLPLGLKWNTEPVGQNPAMRAAEFAEIYRQHGEFRDADICSMPPFPSFTIVTLLRRMLKLNPADRVSMDRVYHISCRPNFYNDAVDRLENELTSQKRLNTNLNGCLAKAKYALKTANCDRIASVGKVTALESELETTKSKLTDGESEFAHTKTTCTDLRNEFLSVENELLRAHMQNETLIKERDTAIAQQTSSVESMRIDELTIEEHVKCISELQSALAAANKQIADQKSFREENIRLKSLNLLRVSLYFISCLIIS